jgi:hypothetical protein
LQGIRETFLLYDMYPKSIIFAGFDVPEALVADHGGRAD